MDEICKDKNSLIEENATLKKKLAQGENLALKLKQLQDSSEVFMVENNALLKENLTLKNNVTELESLKRDVEALQNSLNLAHEEKTSVTKDNVAMKEKICELEHRAKEFTDLQNHFKGANEQIQSHEEENLLLKRKAQQSKGFQKEMPVSNPCKRSEEPLQENNSSPTRNVNMAHSDKYEALLSRFDILNEEVLLLKKENADMMKYKESLSSECASLRQVLDAVSKDKLALEDSNSSLKDDIVNLSALSEEYNVLKNAFCVLRDEKVLVEQENMDLKQKIKHADDLGSQSETLRQTLDKSVQGNLLLTHENALLRDQLQHANEHNLLQNEAPSEKSAQNIRIPSTKNLDDDSSVVNYVTETKLHELLMSKLDEIMHKFKVACKEGKHIAETQEDDIAKIEGE